VKSYVLEFIVPGITVVNKTIVAGSVKVVDDQYEFLDEKGNLIIGLPIKNVKIKNITKSWSSYTKENKTEDTSQ
jgi:hypothetical protein